MMNKLQDIKARFDFWYVKNFFKLHKHWTFYLDLNASTTSFAVKILKKYPDTIVEYSNLNVSDDGQMTFDFNVIANPQLHDTESTGFKRFTGNIMRSMILHSMDYVKREANENGNVDLVESDAERVLHEESVAVSEERVPERKPRKKTVRRNQKVRSQVQQPPTSDGTGDQS